LREAFNSFFSVALLFLLAVTPTVYAMLRRVPAN
jgi:hypothetical protein